jgi:hypothetical protein
VSNVSGYFVILCEAKEVIAKVSYVGYKTVLRRTSQTGMGTIRLRHEVNNILYEVKVTANSTTMNKNKVSFIPSKKEKRISNGGYNLLYHMPISLLSVDPLSKSVTTNLGDGVDMFINGIPASTAEIQNLRSNDIRKIEYLEQPADPRFNNARYALNFVTENYDRGGYTKVDASQGFVAPTGDYSLYSHYEYGKMTYDLLGGFNHKKQSHYGEESTTNYNFPSLTMSKEKYKSGRQKSQQGYATFRAKYVTDAMVIANIPGMLINRNPYMDLTGKTTIQSDSLDVYELSFDSHQKERNYSMEWNGDYFFKLGKGFNLTSYLTASYMNTHQNYDYATDAGEAITNNIKENAWNLKLNATLRKQLKNLSLGLNFIPA